MPNRIDGPPVGGLPMQLHEELGKKIYAHTITFVDGSNPAQEPQLQGSGTLVKAGDKHAILTAWHVIQALPQSDRIGVFLRDTTQLHTLDRQSMSFLKIGYGNVRSEGPDIGAIILSPLVARDLEAMKVFYNLDLRREQQLKNPLDLDDGVWIAQGFLEERSVTSPKTAGRSGKKQWYNFSAVGRPEHCDSIGDYDYFMYPVSEEGRKDAPTSWGGMSGGGLWQVPLKREGNGYIGVRPDQDKELDLFLSGILFYQVPNTDTQCGVKCHGRKSIYEIAYNLIIN